MVDNTSGLISHIQRYSTRDGPGIRTTVFLTNCNLRCLWCANPEAMLPGQKVFYDKSKCKACGLCPRGHETKGLEAATGSTRTLEMVEICPYGAYEPSGFFMSPKELYGRLIRDKAFYEKSGGGVTFSGGEPFLQPEFVLKVTRLLKDASIHVALDTAGLWDFEIGQPLLSEANLVLYDIKAWDETQHRRCTNVSNAVILKNAGRISNINKAMIIRLPIVPGLNDDFSDIEQRLVFAKSLGKAVERVDILKYHNLGEGKYNMLGMEYPLANTGSCDDRLVERIFNMGQTMGLKMAVEGL